MSGGNLIHEALIPVEAERGWTLWVLVVRGFCLVWAIGWISLGLGVGAWAVHRGWTW